uniref:C2H2-type domain-containing protein n=1 Tax=Petromyzon marinus TaxID=7757 RepID=S4RFG8_PETMA
WDASSTDRRSQPSTPSPKPLALDAILPFRFESGSSEQRGDDDLTAGRQQQDEPSPRKRKNSLKVMFQCMWPNCEKVLSTASGMQRHIRRLHLGRNSDSDLSDGEEDFYYSEMEVNMDSLTDGLSSLAPVSPTAVIAPPVFPAPSPPPPPPPLHPSGVCRSHSMAGKREPHPPTQLSRSAPTSFWHPVHTDHAYQ